MANRATHLLAGAVMAAGALVGGLSLIGNLAQWQSISPAYRAVIAAMVAGVVALLVGVLLPPFRGRWRRAALLAGGAGGLLIGVTVLGGVLSGIIPCSGPT